MLPCLSPRNPSLGQLRGCLHGVRGPPLQDLRREGVQLPGQLQVPPHQGLLSEGGKLLKRFLHQNHQRRQRHRGIQVDYFACGAIFSNGSHCSWLRTVTVRMGTTKVSLLQKMRVKVDGKKVTLPYIKLGVLSVMRDGYRVILRTNGGESISFLF